MQIHLRGVVGLLAVMMVALAGCDTAQGPTVPTAQHPTAAPSAAPAASASATVGDSDYDKALRYVRCMNDNGVALPDPVEGKPIGLPTFGIGESAAELRAAQAAYRKCKQFMPATWPVKVDLTEAARERPFNDCMREDGFPRPEPDANGMVHESTDGSQQMDPNVNAAVAKCRHLLDDKANNQSENQ
jgi:hypothetical protein